MKFYVVHDQIGNWGYYATKAEGKRAVKYLLDNKPSSFVGTVYENEKDDKLALNDYKDFLKRFPIELNAFTSTKSNFCSWLSLHVYCLSECEKGSRSDKNILSGKSFEDR